MQLVLASSSPYRRALLERLGLPFSVDPPGIEETAAPGESARAQARRLAAAKAHEVGARHPGSLVIGSDQLAVLDKSVLGKPGHREANIDQLVRASGREVLFLTGLCLLDTRTGRHQLDVVDYQVRFRSLTLDQIRHYVSRERPYDCAGGFKSEGLGLALFERMTGNDPSALVGLPLIRLVEMLAKAGVDVLGAATSEELDARS